MSDRADALLDFVQLLDRLASLPRTGWLLAGLTDVESVAEHSFGVAAIAACLVDQLRESGTEIDGERVLRMALLHDVGEVFTGDVPKPAKIPALARALADAEDELVGAALPEPALSIWREAREGRSLEAEVVKAADKLHLLIKAHIYATQGRGDVAAFWERADPERQGLAPARAVLETLLRRRGRVGA